MIGKGEEIPVSSGRIKFDFFLLATYCTAPEFSLTTMINYYLWYMQKKLTHGALSRERGIRCYTLCSTPSHQHSTRTSPKAFTSGPRTCRHWEFSLRYRSWQTTSARWRTEKRLLDRADSPLSCPRSPPMVIPPCDGDCSIYRVVVCIWRGGGCRSSGKMPSL